MTKENSKSEEIISIFIQETIIVEEFLIIGLLVERLIQGIGSERDETIVTVAEYRQLLGDTISTDKQIVARLKYLEAFCRNIIKPQLQIYEKR